MALSLVIIFNIFFTFTFVLSNPLTSNIRQIIKTENHQPSYHLSSTTNKPDSNIDDPNNAATSTTSLNQGELCETKCYSKVIEAQKLYAEHRHLMKKEKQLIRRKNNLALNDAPDTSNPQETNPRRPQGSRSTDARQSHQLAPSHQLGTRSPTIRNRSLNSYENEQIVVSRLRVARSTNGIDDREPSLEQLRLKREKKFTEVCRSLWGVQSCLGEVTRECIGNLQYHTLEVISNQWFEKLNCPPSRNPDFKPYKELLRSIPKYDDEKIPVPRPISSYEHTHDKLVSMFGKKNLGVMLPTKPSTQKSNSIAASSTQFFQVMNPGIYSDKGSGIMSAQIILIGCILTMMISLIVLTGLYFKGPPKI